MNSRHPLCRTPRRPLKKVHHSESLRYPTFYENAVKLKISSISSAPYNERDPPLSHHPHFAGNKSGAPNRTE